VSSSAPPLDASVEFSVGLKLRRTAKRLSRRGQRRLYLGALVAVDALLLMATFGVAYLVRFRLQVPLFQMEALNHSSYYFRLSLAILPLWLSLFWAYQLYNWETLLGGMKEYSGVFQACVSGAILIALAQFFVEDLIVARGWVGLTWVLAFGLVASGRLVMRRLAYAARRAGYLQAPALLLGANEEGRLLGQQLLAWPTSGVSLLGYVDDMVDAGSRVCGNLYVLGSFDRIDELIR
jgi:FlaA1/EpsC-like NDP-sugar epimerase